MCSTAGYSIKVGCTTMKHNLFKYVHFRVSQRRVGFYFLSLVVE